MKRLAFRTGYNIELDTHHGFDLYAFGWRLAFGFDWPRIAWFNRDWAVDEKGTLRSLPVLRRKPKKWLIRGISWPVRIKVGL